MSRLFAHTRPLAQKRGNGDPCVTPSKRPKRAADTPKKTKSSSWPLAHTSRNRTETVAPCVGSVLESDAAHWQAHRGKLGAETCCRCLYIQNKAQLQREAPWCSPRPGFMGGRWRLGCDVCAWNKTVQCREKHGSKRRGNDVRANFFASYSFGTQGVHFGVAHARILAHATHVHLG